MPTITNLPQLKINYLTQAQYDAAVANDEIDEDQLYFTPDGFLDKFYPVGTIYETLDSTFDPNTAWGGVWDRVIGRVILGAFDAGELTATNQVNSNAGFGNNMTRSADPTDWEIPVGDTGGEYSHLLTATESGTTAHGHGFTRPTVSSSGFVDNGITGGSHSHNTYYQSIQRGSGSTSTRVGPYGSNYTAIATNSTTHTHDLPNHTHTLTGGSVGTSTAANASSAHNNTMPFLAANIWKRIA